MSYLSQSFSRLRNLTLKKSTFYTLQYPYSIEKTPRQSTNSSSKGSKPRLFVHFNTNGLKWEFLTEEQKETIFQQIKQLIDSQSTGKGTALANLIYHLGKIDFHYDDYPLELKQNLENEIILSTKNNDISLVGRSLLLYGYGTINANWNKFDITLQQSLITLLMTTLENPQLTCQGYANIMHGIGKMKLNWNNLSSTCQQSIQSNIIKFYRLNETNNEQNSLMHFASIVYGLGETGCRWEHLTNETQHVIIHAIQHLSVKFQGEELANILLRLADMEARWSALDDSFKGTVKNIITQLYGTDELCQKSRVKHFALCIRSLGLMKCNWSTLDTELKTVLLNAIAFYSVKLNSRDKSNIRYGMSLMGNSLYSSQVFKKHGGSNQIAAESFNATATDSSTTATGGAGSDEMSVKSLKDFNAYIHSLSKQTIRWKNFTQTKKNSFLTATEKVLGIHCDKLAVTTTEQDIHETVYFLYYLSKIELSFDSLPQNTQMKLHAILPTIAANVTPFQYSLLVYSLSCLELSFQGLSPAVQSSLEEKLIPSVERLDTQEISNIVYGLGNLSVQWKDSQSSTGKQANHYHHSTTAVPGFALSAPCRDALMRVIVLKYTSEEITRNQESKHIAKIIYGLGKLKCHWQEDFSNEFRVALQNGVIYGIGRINRLELSNIIHGMGKLSAPWAHFLPEYRRVVAGAIVRYYGSAKGASQSWPRSISSVFYGLGKSHCLWDDFETLNDEEGHGNLGSQVRAALFNGVVVLGPKYNAQCLANTIYGMGKMRISWHTLEPQVANMIDMLLQRFYGSIDFAKQDRPQHIASIVFGLAESHCLWKQLPETTRRSLVNGITALADRANRQEIDHILYGMNSMEADWNDMPDEYKQVMQNHIQLQSKSK